MAWVLLVVAVLSNVAANLLFKHAMQAFPSEPSFGTLLAFLFNPYLWLGGISCTLLLGCYLLAIRDLNLSVSYAFVTSLSLVGITLSAAVLFRESLSAPAMIGVALVVAGILTISLSADHAETGTAVSGDAVTPAPKTERAAL